MAKMQYYGVYRCRRCGKVSRERFPLVADSVEDVWSYFSPHRYELCDAAEPGQYGCTEIIGCDEVELPEGL